MSWFSDIAGRAEDLLNKVDKSAASALQKGKENETPRKGSSVVGPFLAPPYSHPPEHQVAAPVLRTSSEQQRIISGVPTASVSIKSSKAKKLEEDDQLLAFLNSPEPVKSGQPTKKDFTSGQPSNETTASTVASNEGEKPTLEPQSAAGLPADLETKELEQTGSSSSTEVDVKPEAVSPDLSPDEGTTGTLSTASSEITKTWSLEQEVEHFRLEAEQGRQLLRNLQRALQEEQGEKHRLQKKLEHWTSQVSESDGLLRELQNREGDLKGLLSAKDSQLAVLKVRLQEADQRLDSCQYNLTDTQRQLEEQLNLNNLQKQSLDNVHAKLSEVEASLHQQQLEQARVQRESQELFGQKEEELRNLSENLVAGQKNIQQLKGQNRDLVQQLGLSRQSLETAQQELSQYRLKAQRVLQSKEKLIVALKERSPSGDDSLEESFQMVDAPGVLDQEADHEALREELLQAQALSQALRQELAASEEAQTLEAQMKEEQVQNLQERLRSEEQKRREAQLEMQQCSEELRYLREDTSRTKSSLQSRIKDREVEIEKLRKQVTAKLLNQGNGASSTQQRELESRLKNLTENLIQKQTLVEALSTEKNSLAMQMEVMERKLKEMLGTSNKGPTHIVGITTEGTRERLPSLLLESPYDSTMTRKVKRAYSALDAFSIRMGSFLRRYPAGRAFLFLYMALLHVWVMVVLCTYQPEIHPAIIEKNRTL